MMQARLGGIPRHRGQQGVAITRKHLLHGPLAGEEQSQIPIQPMGQSRIDLQNAAIGSQRQIADRCLIQHIGGPLQTIETRNRFGDRHIGQFGQLPQAYNGCAIITDNRLHGQVQAAVMQRAMLIHAQEMLWQSHGFGQSAPLPQGLGQPIDRRGIIGMGGQQKGRRDNRLAHQGFGQRDIGGIGKQQLAALIDQNRRTALVLDHLQQPRIGQFRLARRQLEQQGITRNGDQRHHCGLRQNHRQMRPAIAQHQQSSLSADHQTGQEKQHVQHPPPARGLTGRQLERHAVRLQGWSRNGARRVRHRVWYCHRHTRHAAKVGNTANLNRLWMIHLAFDASINRLL